MKNIKQVYTSLKFDDGQLQILTAEYFNTRFDVINTYTAPLEGILDYHINDEEALINCIKKGINEVSTKIGASLERCILVLPPLDFKRVPLRVSVLPTDGILRKRDIARAVTNSLKTIIDDSLMVINTHIIKYTINGISTRRFPENEVCEEALVDIDLLAANKEMAYSYVHAVSKAGLEILDLTLNNYAIARENVALDNSINQNIILLDIGNNITYLSLLSKGKLLSSEIIYDGMDNIYECVYDELHLPTSTIPRLVKYNTNFNSNHPDDAIYAWDNNGKSAFITTRDLSDIVKKPLETYVDKISYMCKPITENGAIFYVTGEGSNMLALIEELKSHTNLEIKTYYPDTIGARNANLCAVYGAIYVYKEKAELNNLNVNCVNISQYETTVDQKQVNVEGESITSKIKNLFEIYRDRGDI